LPEGGRHKVTPTHPLEKKNGCSMSRSSSSSRSRSRSGSRSRSAKKPSLPKPLTRKDTLKLIGNLLEGVATGRRVFGESTYLYLPKLTKPEFAKTRELFKATREAFNALDRELGVQYKRVRAESENAKKKAVPKRGGVGLNTAFRPIMAPAIRPPRHYYVQGPYNRVYSNHFIR
jgi:hypothetical protein